MIRSPIVLLGKTGDLVSSLPALKFIHETTGQKPKLIVSEEFKSVLDGVSYVDTIETNFRWPHDTPRARDFADKAYGSSVVPQFWNDPERKQGIPHGTTSIEIGKTRWHIDGKKWPNYMAAMWGLMGLSEKEMKEFPMIFDKRDQQREEALRKIYIHRNKPTLLVNFQSGSSPFPFEPEMMRSISNNVFHIVDLSKIKSNRFYDLLGLYDVAAGMITCDTATLHLAAASKIPYVAFTPEHWSGSVPKGNCKLRIGYKEARQRVGEMEIMLKSWASKGKVVQFSVSDDPPSITKQTPWNCQLFDFSKSTMPPRPGTDYFNCGLVARPDGDWLIVRRSEWRANMAYGMNDLLAFRLDGMTPVKGVQISIPSTYPAEHFEDPRAIYHNGKTLVSCTNFTWGKYYTGAHQIVANVNENWRAYQRADVVYGHNGPDLKKNTGSEKNWLWFYHDEKLHMIYQTFPHVVARFDDSFQEEETWETSPLHFHWPIGQPRGGTPPILVGDEYWTFFHSSDDCRRYGLRRYYMGAYAFQNKPPFSMTRMVKSPILTGSAYDRRGNGKPLVVFPCGSIFRNGKWTVTMGVNDLDCAYIEIPHEELLELTHPLLHSINHRLNKVAC